MKDMPKQDLPFDYAVNRFGFYCVPEAFQHTEVAKKLRKGEVNEPRTLELISRMVGEGDVISGGSFIGDFLPPLSSFLVPGARVHSFEPNPDAYDAAQQVIALNKLDNVELHPVAVGKEEAVLPFQNMRRSGKAMGGLSKIVEEHIEGQTVEVPVTRLDDLIDPSRKISVLQLDIEGQEWPALQGAQGIITRNMPMIVVESLETTEARVDEGKLAELAPDAGYKFMGKMERNSFFLPLAARGL